MEQGRMAAGDVLALLDGLADACGPLAVVGSMNADYTADVRKLPKPGETVTAGPLRILPGGKSGNQAASAARLGAHALMLGAVGDDANAEFLLGCLNDAGVDVSQVAHVAGASGATLITVDDHGENTIVYSPGSNAAVDAAYVRAHAEAIERADVLGLCLESPLPAVIEAARIAHRAGTTVLVNDSPFRADLPAELIEASDILLVNEHEMAMLLGMEEPSDGDWNGVDWSAVAEALAAYGYRRAVVTLGADGSVVVDEGVLTRIEAVRVRAVDTTGCGDAFMGTVLAGLAAGAELVHAAQAASYVSAYAATGRGAQTSYGTVEQIRELFA